ncbi:MAG: hypothetical protein IKI29_00305 [Clostridia bacterium]|nr:hypothetical protein [Clostridia bacterium]
MTASKRWLVILLVFSIICSVLTVGTAVNALLPTEDQLPVVYDLFDYYGDIDASYQSLSTLKSTSPWSVQMQIDGQWTSADTISVTSAGKAKGYYSARNWEESPGFSYNINDGEYCSVLFPCNKANEATTSWKINSAYAFTAPVAGTYTFSKSASEQKVTEALTDYFGQHTDVENRMDFGVRITVNNETIWPKSDNDNYYEGYVRFGANSLEESVLIPTIKNIHLLQGDALRVEVTCFGKWNKSKKKFTGATAGADQAVTGCVAMKLTEMDPAQQEEQQPPDEPVATADHYELYDYFNDVVKTYQNEGSTNDPIAINSKSNWSVQCYFDDQWNEPDTVQKDGSYYYVGNSNRAEWGNFYPGYAFYYNPNVVRNQLAIISPTNAAIDQSYDANSAYVFKATLPGTYTFHYSNADKAVSFADTQYFSPYELSYTGITFGVRITLNDEVIWPTVDNYNAKVTDTYAVFGRDINGVPSEISIPKLSNLKLLVDDVLRVEFTSFTEKMDAPWEQRVKGCVSMERNSTDTTKDTESPVFNNGNIICTETGENHLVLGWPSAKDNVTKGEDLSYTLYYDTVPYEEGVIPTHGTAVGVGPMGAGITKLSSETTYYFALMVKDESYNKAVIVGGPFQTQKGNSNAVATYEVYDYLDEVADRLPFETQKVKIGETLSPWVAEVQVNGKWEKITLASRLGDLIYCNSPNPEWGGYYPGFSFYAPRQAVIKRAISRLNPTKAAASVNADFDYCMAYTFRAPAAGVYTFEKGNPVYAYSDYLGDNFAIADSASKDLQLGVRIVKIDGEGEEILWPKSSDGLAVQDGFATITGYGSATGKVPIPTIEGLQLLSGDMIRVEARAFSATADSPWLHQVSAYVRMVMNKKIEDKTPPEFGAGSLAVTAKTSNSLSFSWPLATDNMSRDDSLVYKLYMDTNPITEDRLAELEENALVVSGGAQRVTMLESDRTYYAALTVTDPSGNSSVLFCGPVSTDRRNGQSGGEQSGNLPTEPFKANRGDSECGLISVADGVVQVGWNASGAVSYYQVYLFADHNGSYSLAQNSSTLAPTVHSYEFSGLNQEHYIVQVVGYNNQGEPFEIFPQLSVTNPSGSGFQVSGGSSMGSVVQTSAGGASTGKTTMTYITNEGITEVQDLYETVTKTKTVTNGPSMAEQILWIALLAFGGLLFAASVVFLILLLKKPKNKIV